MMLIMICLCIDSDSSYQWPCWYHDFTLTMIWHWSCWYWPWFHDLILIKMILTMMTCLKQRHCPKEGLVTEFLSSVYIYIYRIYSTTTSYNQCVCFLSQEEDNPMCAWNAWVQPTDQSDQRFSGKAAGGGWKVDEVRQV